MTPVVQAANLSKRYRIGRSLPSLRDMLGTSPTGDDSQYHWAAKDVSFSLEKGEALGIIGPNGAGKTTIMKMLSRVTQPSSGTLQMNGRFSALIELGAGFHPDLTGRENVFLNGSILGMRRAEIRRQFDNIVEFSGIGRFIDTPVKRYSSGMYARLGFAIAAHVNPQIMLVDEVLAVGDYAFQQKCHARMDELRRNGTTVIFISHNLEAVRRVCTRGMVMYRGQAIFQGETGEAIAAYSNAVRESARKLNGQSGEHSDNGLAQKVISFDLEIERVELQNSSLGQSAHAFHSGDDVTLAIDCVVNKPVANPVFSFFIRTPSGQLVYNTTTKWLGMTTPSFGDGERHRIEFNFPLRLLEGEYVLGVDAASAELTHYYDRLEHALTFYVRDNNSAVGIADLGATFNIKPYQPQEVQPT